MNRNITEYKDYWGDGSLWWHCLYKDGVRHGEFKSYFSGPSYRLMRHQLYIHGVERNLSPEESKEINEISSKEEYLKMVIKYGVPLLAGIKYDDFNRS